MEVKLCGVGHMQVDKMSTSIEGKGNTIAPSHALWRKNQEKKINSNKEHCSDITKTTQNAHVTPTSQGEGW